MFISHSCSVQLSCGPVMLCPDHSSAAGKDAKMWSSAVSSFWGLHRLDETASRDVGRGLLWVCTAAPPLPWPVSARHPSRHPRCGSQERSLTSHVPVWALPAAQRTQLLQLVGKNTRGRVSTSKTFSPGKVQMMHVLSAARGRWIRPKDLVSRPSKL